MTTTHGTAEDRLAILDALNDIYADLDDLVTSSHPLSDAERAAIAELAQSRGHVVAAIDRITASGLVDVATSLHTARTQLQGFLVSLAAAKTSVDHIKLGITIGAQVLAVAAQIVAAVA